jgi:hypothetical protein
MDNKIKRWGLSIILVVIMFIVLIITSNIVKAQNNKLKNAEQKIAQLQNSQKVNDVSEKEQNKEVKQNISGLNTARVKTDDAIITEFLNKCLNWNSYAEYKAAYNTISQEYAKSVTSTFLNTFFPDIKETRDNTNPIDSKGLNLKFEKLTSHVINISSVDDAYTYFSEVKVTSDTKYTDSNNDSHTVSGAGTIVLTYTINGDGVLSNVSAYTVVE